MHLVYSAEMYSLVIKYSAVIIIYMTFIVIWYYYFVFSILNCGKKKNGQQANVNCFMTKGKLRAHRKKMSLDCLAPILIVVTRIESTSQEPHHEKTCFLHLQKQRRRSTA